MKVKEYYSFWKNEDLPHLDFLKWQKNPFLKLIKPPDEILYGKEGLEILKRKKLTRLLI